MPRPSQTTRAADPTTDPAREATAPGERRREPACLPPLAPFRGRGEEAPARLDSDAALRVRWPPGAAAAAHPPCPSGGSMRVFVVVGTRPEAIKLAPLVLALRADPFFEVTTCLTSQ